MTGFLNREPAAHVDGSTMFATDEDNAEQRRVESRVARALACQIHEFGILAPIDCYATRDGRIVGLVEIKRRDHEQATFGTVFLNVRKWLALTMGAVGMGIPALFVVEWSDALGWVDATKVDAARMRMGGMRDPRKGSDVEPVIEVPVERFTTIGGPR